MKRGAELSAFGLCAAKQYTKPKARPDGGCPWAAIKMVDGYRLCWVHARTVEMAVAPLSEVLSGTRSRRVYEGWRPE